MLAYKSKLILVFGGGAVASALDAVQAYNVSNDSWIDSYAVMPEARTTHCAVSQGDDVWVMGGRSPV